MPERCSLMANASQSVYQTLVYADLFDFPLKVGEVYKYLIAQDSFSLPEVEGVILRLVREKQIGQKGELFFLLGKEGACKSRELAESITQKKLKSIELPLYLISLIPWVKFVGLTGDLACQNGRQASDVDLMIVTSMGRLWLTRLVVFLILELLGLKMKGEKRGTKICVNVWCDEANLAVPEEEKDLVLASDLAHITPLVNKAGTYEKFIEVNLWLKKYLPNWSV